jgi:acyl-CoA thioesterase
MITEHLDQLTERMGIRCEQSEPGVCIATLDATPDHCNKHGFVHGAVLFAMADVGMGSAVATAVNHEKLVVSLSVNSNYVKPSIPGEIKACCTIIRLGKTVAVTRAEIRNSQGNICALFTADFHISDYN